MKELIKMAEGCRIARMPYRAFWGEVVSGNVDAVREGREWRVSREDAERLGRERGASLPTDPRAA